MYRYLTALLMLVGLMASSVGQTYAQQIQRVSGILPPGATKYFFPRVPGNSALDTIYYIVGDYHIGGKLQIAENAEVHFLDNSRIVDSTGGKIIANGYATLPGLTNYSRAILFLGTPEGDTSYEWGHFVILPNSDSAYFANVQFTNFRKRNSVDQTQIYNGTFDPAHAVFNNAINNAMNGFGGVIATFSAKTFIYHVQVDGCQASFGGGAFAFLQAPAGWPLVPPATTVDDGRLALKNHQVCWLTIRDTRVYNAEPYSLAPPIVNNDGTGSNVNALGGAIYMASNNPGYLIADNIVGYLGDYGFVGGVPGAPQTFTAAQDQMIFERCSANNTFGTASNFAKGGAIYVGTNTGLIISQCTFNRDSAIDPVDLNTWGGAIAVSAYSGSPNENPATQGNALDQMPGLAIYKTATFSGNLAGVGGAIQLDNPLPTLGINVPRLIINAEPVIFPPGVVGPVLDSGLILFGGNDANSGNRAYTYGGAIYSQNQVYIEGYLAPSNYPWVGGPYAEELRVKFSNNVAGLGGGSIFLDELSQDGSAPGGTPDLFERRSWHLGNSVNPFDSRLNPTGGTNRGAAYGHSVLGGGAEYVGSRDSTFATEYNGNLVVNGNGGAVAIEDLITSNGVPVNRFFAENEFNAQNPTIPRDNFSSASVFPFDQRELTRFINNTVQFENTADQAALSNYSPSNPASAHGRGGGLYILITNAATPGIPNDSTLLSRVRFEHNTAYSGSAIWSDNYDLKIMSNQCLIANNIATSDSSSTVDLDNTHIANPGDPNVGATIWGDFEGALPSYETNSRGDAIYDNTARYILRLPLLTAGARSSGVDTLRGNFWGETGPGINTFEPLPRGVQQNTFFIDFYKGCYTNVYEPKSNPAVGYTDMVIGQPVPDTLLMEGRVYDINDAGGGLGSIKDADYSNRRLAPAEAFSLGLPDTISRPHRMTRNIFDTNANYADNDNVGGVDPDLDEIDHYQTDFVGPHPLGYPLFLQAFAPLADSNRDDNARDYTTFLVFNTTTGEFVRVNLKEVKAAEGSSDNQQTYQGRLDFVPDSSAAERHPNLRGALLAPSLLQPSGIGESGWTFANVQSASIREDSAALKGREYSLSPGDLETGKSDSVSMDCESGGPTGTTIWYAGEKYHTLPVRPGDNILVISRTMLWRYGVGYAIANGIQFTIGDVQAPNFVADIPNLQSQTINPNIKFVKRDINYNGATAATTLFRVAGFDPNSFYDPRWLFNPFNYTSVALTVTPDLFNGDVVPTGPNYIPANAKDSVEAHVRMYNGTLFPASKDNWLYYSVIFNQNITGSNGYIELKGQPRNPDIVPGGESLTATVTNFPPNYASEDSLLTDPFLTPGQLGPDAKSLSMWVFPPYMNCADRTSIDTTTAIPDTLCVRATTTTYHFKIIVQDSLPVFDSLPKSKCGYPYPMQVAILTDRLRFSLDLNTDVEREDSIAAADSLPAATSTDVYKTGPQKGALVNHPAWDFRYGRTSYRFVTWPSWFSELPTGTSNYVAIDSSDPNFLLRGIIKVSMDSTTAVGGNPNAQTNLQLQPPTLIDPNNPTAGFELNLDTVVAVEANDGHTGKNVITFPVTVIYAPTILTTTLATAKEGVDYSLNFQDPSLIQRILVENQNPEHPFTYHLVYKGKKETWYRDNVNKVPQPITATDTVGGHPDTVVGLTPSWLSIDPFSGVLTGVPGVTDAPHNADIPCGPDSLTVVVSDGLNSSYCVAAWTNIAVPVDSVNHSPKWVAGPGPICVTNKTTFCDSIRVYDPDLRRDSCAAETITLSDTNTWGGLTINGKTVFDTSGQLSKDTVTVQVCGIVNEPDTYFTSFPLAPYYVELVVTDKSGLTDTLRYPVHIGEPPVFECTICVMNAVTPLHPLEDMEQLSFGAGTSATDSIDQQYCEYELAPPPPANAFDARWILPIGGSVEGTTVDIRSNANALTTWQVAFQPGDGSGGGSLYPVEICWRPSCLDPATLPNPPYSKGHFYLRDPQSAQEFSIDMFLAKGSSGANAGPIDNSLYSLIPINSDSECLQIRNTGLTNAIIVFEPAGSGVGTESAPEFSMQPNYPNPFPGSTTLNFSVANRSNVRIDIYDVKGTLVRTVVNEPLDAGSYPVTWDGMDASGSPVPDGTYLATMRAGDFSASVKMSLERGAE